MLRVVSINTWHGFLLRGTFGVMNLEPPGRKDQREAALIAGLEALEPDVVCLQEAKPVHAFSQRVADALGMTRICAINNPGLRLGPWQLLRPIAAGEGLAILARPELGLAWEAGRRLSGFKLVSPPLAFQTGPVANALAGTITHRGRRIAVICAHVRYTFPSRGAIVQAWGALEALGEVEGPCPDSVRTAWDRAMAIRDREIGLLGRFVDRYRRRGLPVVLGADLNLDSDAPQVRDLVSRRAGVDALHDRCTWDPEGNPNVAYSTSLRWPDGQPKSLGDKLVAAWDARPQTPDHLMAFGAPLASGARVLDEPPAGYAVLPADHYGISADLALEEE